LNLFLTNPAKNNEKFGEGLIAIIEIQNLNLDSLGEKFENSIYVVEDEGGESPQKFQDSNNFQFDDGHYGENDDSSY
jgi:hypothetical protein